ncbi:MAG: hypothetical protein JSU73_09415 [candidate division WOR-3 bacterium]|nr:MAG: hypothetical protein JSU73_09415 [candidate division WOR-3 bacterium]
MHRIAVVFLAVLCLLMLAAKCQQGQNQPPAVPEVSGPSSGRPGQTLGFTSKSEDPEAQEVSHKFSWGDTSAIEWSPYYASDQAVLRTHAYADTGVYYVCVKARDVEEMESDWSDSLRVHIGVLPPGRPDKPEGPELCTTYVSHEFSTTAEHPLGDDIAFQFDWNGETSAWGEFIESGSTYVEAHAFDSAGTYYVSARAKDESGGISDWSERLEVPVTDIPGGPPDSLALQLETDSTVRLSWVPPVEGTPNTYLLLFREAGDPEFKTAIDTLTTSVEHDPEGRTGDYIIAARFGALVYQGDDTVTTIPIHTDTKTVEELNGSGLSGWGWIRTSYIGELFSMNDTLSIPYVDWYVTDFDSGTAGPLYSIASPSEGPTDPGGGVPEGNWHLTEIAGPLDDAKVPVPVSGDSAYSARIQIQGSPTHYAVVTADGYYAMIKVTNVRTNQSDIRAQAWLQPIRGLRLLRH